MTLTRREIIRPRGSLARRVVHGVAAAALVAGFGACNESFVPNYNYPSAITPSQQGVNGALLGAFNPRSDVGNWAVWSSGFGREATYFTLSEQRFVTELVGVSEPQSTDFIGETVWDNEFGLIKTADSAQKIVGELLAGGTDDAAQAEASWAVLETAKALDYMYPAESRDSLGVPINAVGQVSAPYAPILCNELVWAQIVAMFDSAADSLTVSGPTPIPNTMPPGFGSVSASATSFLSLTLALRAKARIEYAYAIARQDGQHSGALTDPAAVAQLDSAQSDILGVSFYTPSAGLTPTAANMPNDAGVFYTFSTQGNDVVNPIFSFVKGYYALVPYVIGIGSDATKAPGTAPGAPVDTLDNRWTAKFIDNFPFVPGSSNPQYSSSWNYANNLSGSTSMPVIRNLELSFLWARTQIGLGMLPAAVTTLNNIRVNVGGVSAFTPSPENDSTVKSMFITEARLSFIAEGTGEDISATRDFGLEGTYMISADDSTGYNPGGVDTKFTVLPIPIEESSPRNGDITPVCTGAGTHVVSTPSAKRIAPKASSIIHLQR
jgi:hypothetical protein